MTKSPYCRIPGCHRKRWARGLCGTHYQRWRKHGDPSIVARTPAGEKAAYVRKILPSLPETDDCILWPYPPTKHGYGDFVENGHRLRVNIAVCEQFHGPKPFANAEAAHRCGNRLCVNPKHIYWASRKENAEDMVDHGRSLRGERNPRALLTGTDVTSIRRAIERGEKQKDIAIRYNIDCSLVSMIKHRKRWAWLP